MIAFAKELGVSDVHALESPQERMARWFGIPLVWTCFLSPSTCDASLRAIAAHFDEDIQARAEEVIEANRKKIESIVARYRPRLRNKLVLDFYAMPEVQKENYHLLGMRIGTPEGWPGKTGVWRTPRLVCDRQRWTSCGFTLVGARLTLSASVAASVAELIAMDLFLLPGLHQVNALVLSTRCFVPAASHSQLLRLCGDAVELILVVIFETSG